MTTSARNYDVRQPVPGGPIVKAWVHGVPIEPDVWKQVDNIAAVPGVQRIAVMPDAHIGHGACVGSAILTRDVVIPAAVGVDIGCGMIASPIEGLRRSHLGDRLPAIRAAIEARVPVGRTNNGRPGDTGAWAYESIPPDVEMVWDQMLKRDYVLLTGENPSLQHPSVLNHLGTLGTGNHFIEVCIELPPPYTEGDPDPQIWVMLHSGSRGVGNKIGSAFTRWAREEMARWHVSLPDPDLGFLPRGTQLFDDYLNAATWAQRYAWESRLLMYAAVLEGMSSVVGHELLPAAPVVHCHHNYVTEASYFGKSCLLTRKGAVDAGHNVLGIIPGSMGARSYITRGLGNAESLNTSSHGAGRVMSRGVARRTLTMEEHLAAVAGVECRLDEDVIDESPACYKDIDAVMAAQSDLTEPVAVLKQIIVVKG